MAAGVDRGIVRRREGRADGRIGERRAIEDRLGAWGLVEFSHQRDVLLLLDAGALKRRGDLGGTRRGPVAWAGQDSSRQPVIRVLAVPRVCRHRSFFFVHLGMV